jgi:undecaprenyl-diphosphatase
MLKHALLGLAQGVTEWLPVSSSGHLVFLQHFMKIGSPVFFDALVHLASILVVLAVFWKDILAIIMSLFDKRFSKYRKYWLLIPIGTVPAVIAGLAFKHQIEALFSGFGFLALAFLFTGIVLLLSRLRFVKGLTLSPAAAFAIGIAQAIALVPGVSRSGMTLSVALMLGINRKEAGRFAFLLAIPAIAGAFLLQIAEGVPVTLEAGGAIVGFIAAFLAGLFSLKLLLRVLKSGKLHYFSIWCFLMALLTLLL